jgi:hypothetical protein
MSAGYSFLDNVDEVPAVQPFLRVCKKSLSRKMRGSWV